MDFRNNPYDVRVRWKGRRGSKYPAEQIILALSAWLMSGGSTQEAVKLSGLDTSVFNAALYGSWEYSIADDAVIPTLIGANKIRRTVKRHKRRAHNGSQEPVLVSPVAPAAAPPAPSFRSAADIGEQILAAIQSLDHTIQERLPVVLPKEAKRGLLSLPRFGKDN